MNAAAAKPSPTSSGRRFRLPLRFSLRMFLAVITIFCVALGWRINRARLQRDAVAAIRSAGGTVHYDYQQRHAEANWDEFDETREPWDPVWMRQALGIDFFHDVTDVGLCSRRGKLNIAAQLARFPRLRCLWVGGIFFNNSGLRAVGRLQRLEFCHLSSEAITDDGIARLKDLPRLKHLDIQQAKLGDSSLHTLSRLPRLEYLEMDGDRLTDAGLTALAGHPRLKHLRLGTSPSGQRSRISDAGVVHLARLPLLEELGLQSSCVTPAGLLPLQSLPHLRSLSLHYSTADDYPTVARLLPHCEVYCNSGGPPSNPVF